MSETTSTSRIHLPRTVHVALSTALVVEAVRVAFPLLYDVREDAGAATAVAWALGAFVVGPAVLVSVLSRAPDAVAVAGAVVATAASRLAMQLVHPIPLWLGAASVAIGLTALALVVSAGRRRGHGGATGIGVVAGLAIDTSVFGLFETWDPIWQEGAAATTAGVVLAGAAVVAAVVAARSGTERDATIDAWPMALIGPFLLVQIVYLQNVAFTTSETGVAIGGGVALVVLGDLLGIVAASALLARPHSGLHLAAAIIAVAAVAVLALVHGASVAVAVPVGGGAASTTLVLGLASPAAYARRRAGPGPVPWFVLGITAFVATAFAHQIDVDVPLPVPRASWPIAAAVVVATGGFHRHRPERVPSMAALVPLAGVVIVPLVLASTAPERPEPVAAADSYRVLDWNLHTAVDDHGSVALGDVAERIDAEDPDVIVLQEVGRGWPIVGQADDLEWLARRLDMAYVWAPAADGQFGNAILSRHPIDLDRAIGLPYGEGPQERSAVGATIGADPGLFVVGVHLQHGDRQETRSTQLRAVLAAWADRDAWVLAGDLNMQPGDADLSLLREARLASVQDLIGDPDAPTARDPAFPGDRVDWIWVSANTLDVAAFRIPQSEVSDHLPLVVDVMPRSTRT